MSSGVGARSRSRVVHQDAVPGDAQRVAGGLFGQRQTVLAGEHARRAGRQRREGIGQLGRCALAGGVADVEAAEGDADAVGEQVDDEGAGIGGRSPRPPLIGIGSASAPALTQRLEDRLAVFLLEAVEVEDDVID